MVSRMRVFDLYWMTDPDWYGFADDEAGTPFLTGKAPDKAKESFKRFLEQKKSMIGKRVYYDES